MLCQFSFWNYKSFRDETTLDLCPAKITEHEEHLIRHPVTGEKFLPLAVIYGPNGGGKSNVIDAFKTLRENIMDVLDNMKRLEMYTEKSATKILEHPKSDSRYKKTSFIFDADYAKKPSGWSINFITAGHEYKYNLATVDKLVVEESLYAKDVKTQDVCMLFERKSKIELGDYFESVNVNNIGEDMPLLCFISILYDFDHITNVILWLMSANVYDYSSAIIDKFLLPTDTETEKIFFDLIAAMDIPIQSLETEDYDDGSDIFSVYHFNNKRYRLNFYHESTGTRKAFELLSYIMMALDWGAPLFMDELDAHLHPKMLEFIISLFTSPTSNKKGAQLIFTSHDLYTMDSKFLRRDEIWFAVKRDDFSSHLYSLSEFKKLKTGKIPRKDERYAKQYTEGLYGADPYFQRAYEWAVKT